MKSLQGDRACAYFLSTENDTLRHANLVDGLGSKLFLSGGVESPIDVFISGHEHLGPKLKPGVIRVEEDDNLVVVLETKLF